VSDRKPWMTPPRYHGEAADESFRSTDTEPLDYARGPHDEVFGEGLDDEDEPRTTIDFLGEVFSDGPVS
jgi:hypothetical protein